MHHLIAKYPLISDQVTKAELDVVLGYSEKAKKLEGNFVELGCYTGTTSLFLSRVLLNTDKQLWVYDSFEGLPEKTVHDASPAGFAFKKGELYASKKHFISNYKKAGLPLPVITKAWFKDLSANNIPNKIAFAFLDGDYYESIYDSLNLIKNNLVKDCYVLIHDYGRTTLPGPKKALNQFLAENNNFKLIATKQHIAVISKTF